MLSCACLVQLSVFNCPTLITFPSLPATTKDTYYQRALHAHTSYLIQDINRPVYGSMLCKVSLPFFIGFSDQWLLANGLTLTTHL